MTFCLNLAQHTVDKKEKIAGNKMRLTTAIRKQTVGPLLKLVILTEYENDQWKVIAVFVDELVDQEKDYSVFERELPTVVDALVHFKYQLFEDRSRNSQII
mgnify:CR=1 FL=1